MIITVHNESARIRDKLDNTLGIDYPQESMEVIVASDCSSDATDDIVLEYADRGVRLMRARERLGKEHAQRCAIAEALGEILVFSDVATRIPADAIRKLIAYFRILPWGRSPARSGLSARTAAWWGRAPTPGPRCGSGAWNPV
jgi:cellulose synthase/poly-beta-1,6-N-acetylglucosamine synthase-like glycosyltransferase